nr:MAG TPA: Major capsid protein [Caudoviricetes sp.]
MIGGGDVNPYEGSFDNDDIEIRIRQIAGAGLVSYDGIIGSTGVTDPA